MAKTNTKFIEQVRVRIAPSPTGPLHLGTVRTALFNWLFAKSHNGKFILRIEDTDLERSDKKYEAEIIEGLAWLGLKWDEFYRQSERLETYAKYLKRLLDQDKAYYCYCEKTELEAERQEQIKKGLSPKYSGKCKNGKPVGKTEPSLIRFKMPEKTIEFSDLIRGEIKFDMGLVGDIAIAKNLKTPLYNFAVIVDDFEMKISHVIRGEDHIANTPKQIAMQKALDFNIPRYAHLPLILNPDKSKLSKRYAETSLLPYRDNGYLPWAIINFMALLGWHPKDDREVLMADELIKKFDLKRVQRAGAIFNEEKLSWLNAEHIKKLSNENLAELLQPMLLKEGIAADHDMLVKAIGLEKERIKILKDFATEARFFFKLPEYESSLLIWKDASSEKIKNNLQETYKILDLCDQNKFDKIKLEAKIMPLALKLGKGEVLWPLRAAISGAKASPGPFEIMEVLGKNETLERLKIAISKLSGIAG